jgi:hypothetical protein
MRNQPHHITLENAVSYSRKKTNILFMALTWNLLWVVPLLSLAGESSTTLANPFIQRKMDSFLEFQASRSALMWDIKAFDLLPPNADESERLKALNLVRLATLVLLDCKVKFVSFCAKADLSSDTKAITKPILIAIQAKEFHKTEQALTGDIANADITRLRAIYTLYSKLPFPSDDLLRDYRMAPGSENMSTNPK